MSTVPPSVVYTGFWVDHSVGPVIGATITVTSSTANLLIAFLASLVSLAGLQFWDLIAFFYYFLRVPKQSDTCNGLFYQQQVLLRNTPSPGALITRLIKLAWSWRRIDKYAWLKCLLPICLAFLISSGFIIAGIFSSKVLKVASLDILVRSDSCGWVTLSADSDPAEIAALRYNAQALSAGERFSRTCYNSTANHAVDPACAVFANNTSPFVDVSHTSCPFGQGMCPYGPALRMDTGLLDSQSFWGINTAPSDRLQYRQVTTCAPIKTDGFIRTINAEDYPVKDRLGRDPLPGEKIDTFEYGGFIVNGTPYEDNTTYLVSSYKEMLLYTYTLTSQYAYSGEDKDYSGFSPVPELQVLNATTVLLFVASNRIQYFTEIEDPIFAAHQLYRLPTSQGLERTYLADKPAGVLGCTVQYQFCKSTPSTCTDLTELDPAIDQASSLGLTAMQNTTATFLATSCFDLTSSALSGEQLLASESINDHRQESLPANQWEIEVQNLVKSGLAGTQKIMSDYAVGPRLSDQAPELPVIRPATPEEERLCKSQKMKAPIGFSNISVFGLGFTIGVASLIILLNQLLPGALLAFWRYKNLKTRSVSWWTQDSVLQIQQRAYEGVDGSVKWERLARDVPVIPENHRFEHLSSQPRAYKVERLDSESPSDSSAETKLSADANDEAAKYV